MRNAMRHGPRTWPFSPYFVQPPNSVLFRDLGFHARSSLRCRQRAPSPPAWRCPQMSVKGRIAKALAKRVALGLGLTNKEPEQGEPSPPAALLMGGLASDIWRMVSADVASPVVKLGKLRKFVKKHKPGHDSTPDTVESSDDEDGKARSGRLGSVISLLPSEVADAIENLVSVADDRASAVSSAVKAALVALGVSPDDEDDDKENPVGTPTEPTFDPVTALILAGYAFQAYLEPARGAYWETHATSVQASEVSGMDLQTIHTRVAYPNTSSIAAAADGVYMVRVDLPIAAELDEKLYKERYLTAVLNGTALFEDSLLNVPLNFSVLRKEGSPSESSSDTLVINIYDSKDGFSRGEEALVSAKVSLRTLDAESKERMVGSQGQLYTAVLKPETDEQVKKNFFEFSILPEGMMLPFRGRKLRASDRKLMAENLDGAELHVQVNFIPFDGHPDTDDEDEDEDGSEDVNEDTDNVFDEDVALAVSEQMKEGEIPLDWGKLARDLHAILENMRHSAGSGATYLREDLPKALFIESLDTNSEVWLWRDEVNKQVVISFRGTEQVEWQDFFTDALAFLQAWRPGDDIVLDIKSGVTMGLDLWDDIINGAKADEQYDICAMPCVHWGFLRAYLSLRDSLDEALSTLTNEFDAGYTYYFTGHSLGGALATIAAIDLQARHGNDETRLPICMMNYGSPRVGNRAFAREFNRLVPNAFRIVNGADLIARMPQTPSRFRGGYRHVGRICLVHENGTIWTEGVGETSFDFLLPASIEQVEELVQLERKMWSLLVSGQSLGHHMEDSYYLALKNAVLRKFESFSS